MKISQSVKEKTKAKILTSTVDLIIEKGFKSASMRGEILIETIPIAQ
jgi:AcrR family transcriptional regulator